MSTPIDFTPDERNAMRSFLQRCEVRLSTMHRVATGFLGGAGLLFLFPVFFKDGVLSIIRAFLTYLPNFPTAPTLADTIGVVLIYLFLLYPFVLSLGIPALALGLLIKDIIRFYFVGHPPSYPEDHFNPRFILSGIGFSPDESEQVKSRVLRYEYGTDLVRFVISRADARSRHYLNLVDKPHRKIVPPSRQIERLVDQGVIATAAGFDSDDEEALLRVVGTLNHQDQTERVLESDFVDRRLRDVDQFNAALGLAGFMDRELVEEVAKTEVSLVRHALKLRTLVLRYFQALLILIWTSAVTLMTLPFLEVDRFPRLIVLAFAYFIWAFIAPIIVQLPIYWLVRQSQPGSFWTVLIRNREQSRSFREMEKSDALQRFGVLTQWSCYAALITSLLALLLEVLLRIS